MFEKMVLGWSKRRRKLDNEDDVAHGKERTLDISKIGMSEILVLEERNRIPFWIGRRSESEGKRDARYDVEKCVKSSVS